ncbi:DUF4097 family beta strand repeat-containing protein [Actinomadura litoris]|uniref:DUF4097 family beta strand repeat-containing protein n=1 Tax=Actinomadura litoris TaxID=2678616 RepID=UPI001FA70769|nr:DUF4097 family beta strand repeat-containing protein [Actinomadura litoris]
MRTLSGVAVLAVLAATVTGCGLDFGQHGETRAYDGPAGVDRLKVRSGDGKVEIVASDAPGIKVREKLHWSNKNNKPQARHVTEGGTFSLSSRCARQVIGMNACRISYRIEVPRSIAVDVENSDGKIIVSGLAGAVRLKSGTGGITASDLRATSLSLDARDSAVRVSGRATTADLRTGTGAIIATGLTADRLSARSNDGRIQLSGRATLAELRTGTGRIEAASLTADRVVARTNDGSITLGLLTPPSALQATTGTGDVHVRVPRGPAYAIDVKTGTGSKKIDPNLHHDSTAKRHIKVSTGDGDAVISPA